MAGNLFWLNETFYNNLLHYGATKLEAGGGGGGQTLPAGPDLMKKVNCHEKK